MSVRRTILQRLAKAERYIEGYSVGNFYVSIQLNGTAVSVNTGNDGYWRYDIPANTVLTDMGEMLSADRVADNNNITYVNLSHIGDTSHVTDMHDLCKNCENLTSINFGHINTSAVTDMQGMFNGCYALQSLDLSGLNTSSIPPSTSGDNGMKNLLYMDDSGQSVLSSIALPAIPVYISSNVFYHCDSLTTVTRCGTISKNFKIQHAPLTRASALVLINALGHGVTLTLNASTYSLLTSDDIAIATNKGCTVVSG